ncbi:MAG: FAD-dependent oxidoreductase [Phocaeicola sp.]|nr:FAD-dependent oxidoreductase [Phocaeicola sp.]
MKRREFLTNMVLAGGTLALGGCVSPKDKEFIPKQAEDGSEYITEPAKRVSILAKTDVLVVGGGPAGVAAAVAASRAGAETYLLERYNHLGGLWTGGLVLPLLSTHGLSQKGERVQVIHGLSGEMVDRLRAMNMAIDEVNPTIDPEAGKYVLDEMVSEAGVHVLYHTWAVEAIMDKQTIKGVYIESKSGRQAILAKIVIDCTGDGDVFKWAGEKFDVIKYAIGQNYRVGNADKVNKNAPGYVYQNIGNDTPIPGVKWYNVWGELEQDALDVENLSRLQQKFRKDTWEHIQEVKKMPGYQDIYLLDTASQIGVRLSRILDGEYMLTLEDSMTYRHFDDAIGVSGAWTNLTYKDQRVTPGNRPYWQIPYRSLVPKTIDNLLVAGRCFCYEKALMEDARIIGTCLVTGQGAGVAAALAVKGNELPRHIDIQKLHQTLVGQHVWFGA